MLVEEPLAPRLCPLQQPALPTGQLTADDSATYYAVLGLACGNTRREASTAFGESTQPT